MREALGFRALATRVKDRILDVIEAVILGTIRAVRKSEHRVALTPRNAALEVRHDAVLDVDDEWTTRE